MYQLFNLYIKITEKVIKIIEISKNYVKNTQKIPKTLTKIELNC